ncbi:hypothetical protein VTN77DRAFT_6919 [Rasamsonia byssochlamydoides]|uniref:uncharacterized protein n=1 Tax=Rasamsonia byssochlamydoides TaxID=89139 RepID=UPI0037425ECD
MSKEPTDDSCRICGNFLHNSMTVEVKNPRYIAHGIPRILDDDPSSFSSFDRESSARNTKGSYRRSYDYFKQDSTLSDAAATATTSNPDRQMEILQPGIICLQAPPNVFSSNKRSIDEAPGCYVHTSCWHLLEATLGPIQRAEMPLAVQSLKSAPRRHS